MKELKIEIGEDLEHTIRHFANVSRLKKLKVEINIHANGTSIPDKIEIDRCKELKGYVHEIFHLIKDHLEGKEKSIKEINELKEN